MSCCVVALALAYQLIAAIRRVRAWFGGPPVPVNNAVPLQATLTGLLRRPTIRLVLLSVLTIEGAVAGTLVYEHRFHLHNELAALVFAASGYARDLCNPQ